LISIAYWGFIPKKLQDFELLTTGITFDFSHRRYEVFTKHVKEFNQGIADYLCAEDKVKLQLLKQVNEQRKILHHLFKC
jgi:DNA gyrase/topoisomerase IV subunit B